MSTRTRDNDELWDLIRCPLCGTAGRVRTVDSRPNVQLQAVRRRRQCLACRKRFTTYEFMGGQDVSDADVERLMMTLHQAVDTASGMFHTYRNRRKGAAKQGATS